MRVFCLNVFNIFPSNVVFNVLDIMAFREKSIQVLLYPYFQNSITVCLYVNIFLFKKYLFIYTKNQCAQCNLTYNGVFCLKIQCVVPF